MSRRRRSVLLALLLGAIGLGAAGLGSMTYFHFGDPQNTCASCHEMNGVHTAWSASAHKTLHCRSCHGGSLTLDVHALKSHLNRVVQHVTGDPGKAIHLGERDVLALHDRCRDCHPGAAETWQKSGHGATYAHIFLDEKHNRTEMLSPDCLRCHGMFHEGHIEDLVKPTNTKGPWTLTDPAKAGHPTMPCLACHRVHGAKDETSPAQLYVRNERTHVPAGLLSLAHIVHNGKPVKESTDPGQRMCVQCHAPNALRERGTGDDRTPVGVHEGLSCRDCHGSHGTTPRNSCATCHPGNSHCGKDVTTMDTSFSAKSSAHNIHSVACGDCHQGKRPEAKRASPAADAK